MKSEMVRIEGQMEGDEGVGGKERGRLTPLLYLDRCSCTVLYPLTPYPPSLPFALPITLAPILSSKNPLRAQRLVLRTVDVDVDVERR